MTAEHNSSRQQNPAADEHTKQRRSPCVSPEFLIVPNYRCADKLIRFLQTAAGWKRAISCQEGIKFQFPSLNISGMIICLEVCGQNDQSGHGTCQEDDGNIRTSVNNG